MKAPDVTLENHAAVYEFYAEHQQPRLKAAAYYALLAMKYKPHVHYIEGAKNETRERIRDGENFLIAVNHLTNTHDQFIAAGTAWKSPLRRHIGRMRVIGKDELFRDEPGKEGQRNKIDIMGGIPAFRGKNYESLEYIADLKTAGRSLVDTAALRLAHGDDIAIFPEGTYNQEDPRKLLKINSGIGYIARQAAELEARFSILPIGISYGGDDIRPRDFTHASVTVGLPIEVRPDEKPFQIKNNVRDRLQQTVDHAHALYQGPNISR